MRRLSPPVTEREIAEFSLRTTEKKVGELEMQLRRPVGVGYPERQRRRDQATLARCFAVIEEEEAKIAILDEAEALVTWRAVA